MEPEFAFRIYKAINRMLLRSQSCMVKFGIRSDKTYLAFNIACT